jgi:hypothetical protein
MARRKLQTLGLRGMVVLMAATMSLSQLSALQQETQIVSVTGTEMYIVGQSRQ